MYALIPSRDSLFFMPDQQAFSGAGAQVQLTVHDLPPDVVEQVRRAQEQDPDFLRKALLFGVTHKTVFETLRGAWGLAR